MVLGLPSWVPILGDRHDDAIPGVQYYNPSSTVNVQQKKYEGFLHNVKLDTAPQQLIACSGPMATKPGPEEEPYTWFERMGLAPVHPSRVRARQFYMPTTDFGMFDYDEVSPEERDLTARWMSRSLEFNMAVPTIFMCTSMMICVPLPTKFRLPVLLACAVTGVMIEGVRANLAAAKERQDLDDFILAKEIWHIKNVETYQLGLPRMTHGSERMFHDHAERIAAFTSKQKSKMPASEILPDELVKFINM